MTDVTVVSGGGAYADPWHPFTETSARLASIMAGLGHSVEIREDVETVLSDPPSTRLLVVNIGNPSSPPPDPTIDAIRRGIQSHLGRGGSVLGVHVSATTFTTMPQWSSILGGRWVRGLSMHPPQDSSTIKITTPDHPVTRTLKDFDVYDERYSYLHTEPGITVLCEHEFEGRRHPVIWVNDTAGGRVLYDGLGHDARSYDSPAHVALLERAARWLVGDLD